MRPPTLGPIPWDSVRVIFGQNNAAGGAHSVRVGAASSGRQAHAGPLAGWTIAGSRLRLASAITVHSSAVLVLALRELARRGRVKSRAHISQLAPSANSGATAYRDGLADRYMMSRTIPPTSASNARDMQAVPSRARWWTTSDNIANAPLRTVNIQRPTQVWNSHPVSRLNKTASGMVTSAVAAYTIRTRVVVPTVSFACYCGSASVSWHFVFTVRRAWH